MEPSPAELEKIYSQYTDAELVHIATRSAHHLRPEALAVIRGMLRARNVDEAVFQGIDAAVQPVDEVRVQEQVALIRSLPCPECGNRSAPLNAVLASRAISFLVMTSNDRTPYIGCLPCLERRCTDPEPLPERRITHRPAQRDHGGLRGGEHRQDRGL
jgi:hypothetical protein